MFKLITTSLLLSLLTTTRVALAQTSYVVFNECPTPIKLYISGVLDSTIPVGGNVTRSLGTGPGYFYTDVNGGNADGSQSTRAGFFGSDSYYYIVVDPNNFNTALSIAPRWPEYGNGFCQEVSCSDASCANAYTQAPTAFPTPTSTAPASPLFECLINNLTYWVTFCDGTFPHLGQVINPNFNTAKCLDVKGNIQANGTPVQIYDCNGTGAQNWIISRGSTKVQLAGTNFCLDAGSDPTNGTGMKIWQCYDNLPAQQWYFTDDNRIALEGQGFCLDLTNGVLTEGNIAQIWQCTNSNTNQVWTLSA